MSCPFLLPGKNNYSPTSIQLASRLGSVPLGFNQSRDMSQLELSNIARLRVSPSATEDDASDGENKLPYPKSVFFIVATELSERFSYYGMRAVLTIYMKNMLLFSENEATTFYHMFLLLCYGLPAFWGIIADSFLGKYKTIWIVSILFALGNIVLTLSSITPLNLPSIPMTMVGLVLMAVGTGGMKPCVAPFGGEQFVLPEQRIYLQQFFSVFFFAVTLGNLVSTLITPFLRRDVSCFDMDSCYPLAFGVPAVIMLVAVVVFVSGKSQYKINKPEGNMLVKVMRCVTHAIVNRKYSDEDKAHWLDYADDKFDAGLINDIKMVIRLLIYYIPIPMFFALYEQLGSRWTLQALKMSGQLGNWGVIKPDQMQVSNAVFMFISIPFFTFVVYPLFGRCKLLRRPLQRMGVGGFLAALSFAVAGLVELRIEKNLYVPPSLHESHLKIVNTLPCPVSVTKGGSNGTIIIDPESSHIIPLTDQWMLSITITLNDSCNIQAIQKNKRWEGEVYLKPATLQAMFVFASDDSLVAELSRVNEDFEKSKEANAKLRIVANGMLPSILNTERNESNSFTLTPLSSGKSVSMKLTQYRSDFSYTETAEVYPTEYFISSRISSNDRPFGKVGVEPGGCYLLVVHPDYNNSNTIREQLIVLNTPNEIHMLWLIPQYIIMAWAEILFIVSGMEFSFTQAPKSMKSVLQSLWHLMNAIGNVIVIISAQIKYTHSQATEFFEFAGAMLIDIIIFCLLAMRYRYVDILPPLLSEKDKNDNKDKDRRY